MEIENPLALHYLMHDDLFFLKEDRVSHVDNVSAVPTAEVVKAEIVAHEQVTEASPAGPGLHYMGKKGDMLILVHYAGLEFIHETHLNALENILKRKGAAISEVAILNMAKHTATDMRALLAYFEPKKILVLGEQALPGGIGPQLLNQPKQAGDKKLLYSFSFDDMMESPENKKAFWEQMKNF